MRPRLATVSAKAMVASGAESALPTTVRRSNDKPNVDNSRRAVRQNVGLLLLLLMKADAIDIDMDSSV